MPATAGTRPEADVEWEEVPVSWVGQDVRVEIRDALNPKPAVASSSPFDVRRGQLMQVNQFGIALDTTSGPRFYPWSSVRQLWL